MGVLGDINYTEKKVFQSLLELDTRRGPHSTGVFTVKCDNSVEFDKRVGTPWEFYKESDTFRGGNFNGTLKALVGHNRFATIGDVTQDNAHPFDFDNIIGVHNGTIRHMGSELWLEENGGKFAVDSQMLYAAIEKKGLRDTITNITGAWSCVWWDKVALRLNFFRNADRPMWYTMNKSERNIFFASEPWMLAVALELNKVPFDTISETTPNLHFYVNMDSVAPSQPKPTLWYEKEEIKEKTFPTQAAHRNNYRWHDGGWWPQDDEEENAVGNVTPLHRHTPPVNHAHLMTEQIRLISDKKGLCPVSFGKDSLCENFQNTWKLSLENAVNDSPVVLWLPKEQYDQEFINVVTSGQYFYKCCPVAYYKDPKNPGYIFQAPPTSLTGPFEWHEMTWEDFKVYPDQGKPKDVPKKGRGKNKREKLEVPLDSPTGEEDSQPSFLLAGDNSYDVTDDKIVRIGKSAQFVSATYFDHLMMDGCCMCGLNDLTHEDAENVDWIDYPRTWAHILCSKLEAEADKVVSLAKHNLH